MVAVKVLNMTRILNNTDYGTRKEARFQELNPTIPTLELKQRLL